jgi:hypothetical protein
LDIHIKGYILLYKQRKLQGIRPMGLAQTGQRDPCRASPLNFTYQLAIFQSSRGLGLVDVWRDVWRDHPRPQAQARAALNKL